MRRIWHPHGLKPPLTHASKLGNDSHFAGKLEANMGLKLKPPEPAIAICTEQESQLLALGRPRPGLPLKKGCRGKVTLFTVTSTLDATGHMGVRQVCHTREWRVPRNE